MKYSRRGDNALLEVGLPGERGVLVLVLKLLVIWRELHRPLELHKAPPHRHALVQGQVRLGRKTDRWMYIYINR